MAPQGFETVDPLEKLRRFLERHLDAAGQTGEFYREVDLLLNDDRVARPDLQFLTERQQREQRRISRERGLPEKQYHPVYVTPLLVIESLSVGHERHVGDQTSVVCQGKDPPLLAAHSTRTVARLFDAARKQVR